MREAAATAVLVALTYDQVAALAADAGVTADPAGPPRGRADRARARAAEERAQAIRAWSRAAALESAGY
ncbi:hypothetical protein [Geodermatophilus dictyosporus]|uniref:hypothetical protein n=1 Tax=Geodermatophilus dictyosporus TaxID=1523247 RepID=UPI0010AB2903|nr:hypothetical protein [Geodermatophilus dictyosporus]